MWKKFIKFVKPNKSTLKQECFNHQSASKIVLIIKNELKQVFLPT